MPTQPESDCDASELPSDRMHRSPLVEIAGVVRQRWLDPNGTVIRAAEPVTLNVLASQYLEERRTWVVVTTDERSVEISLETAHELHGVLGRLLEEVRA